MPQQAQQVPGYPSTGFPSSPQQMASMMMQNQQFQQQMPNMMPQQQHPQPSMNCTPQQMMSSPEGMMSMLQAMMQMMNAPKPEPSRQPSVQQQYMQQRSAMMSSQKAPTAADRFHLPQNTNFPSRNINGLDNFASTKNPFFMGN